MSSVTWYTGQTGAGKTTHARGRVATMRRLGLNAVLLDGDELRAVWPGLGYSLWDRTEQNMRTARLAALLAGQGLHVVVATIAPTRALRALVTKLVPDVRWVYVPGGRTVDADHPYEPPLPSDGYDCTLPRLDPLSEFDMVASEAWGGA